MVQYYSGLDKLWLVMNTNHVYVWDDVLDFQEKLKEVERRRLNYQFVTNLKLSLKFGVETCDRELETCHILSLILPCHPLDYKMIPCHFIEAPQPKVNETMFCFILVAYVDQYLLVSLDSHCL